MNNRAQASLEWLVERIGQEIRRGIHLLRENQLSSIVVIESIHFRFSFQGKRRDLVFDGEGRSTLEDQERGRA